MMEVLSYDVARVNHRFQGALHEAARAVIDGRTFILGHELEAFEKAFARYCGVGHCIGVGNGLDALMLALHAIGVRAGDDVLVPAFTFIATWNAVSLLGARPIPVEVDENGLMDPAHLARAITPRSKAVVPVHLYGRLADMEAITEVASRHGLAVVEDAAQAHGASRGGCRAGGFGLAGAFSFYPTKNLGALGDGGAICTNDAALAESCRMLRNYGSRAKYRHDAVGWNSRLDDLQASLLSVKLADLEAANDRRRAVARRYHADLSSVPGLHCPERGGQDMVWHHFVVRCSDRARFQEELVRHGVHTAIHYPLAPFDQPCYAGQYDRTLYPVAIELAETVLSLPMADYLLDEEVSHVGSTVARVWNALYGC